MSIGFQCPESSRLGRQTPDVKQDQLLNFPDPNRYCQGVKSENLALLSLQMSKDCLNQTSFSGSQRRKESERQQLRVQQLKTSSSVYTVVFSLQFTSFPIKTDLYIRSNTKFLMTMGTVVYLVYTAWNPMSDSRDGVSKQYPCYQPVGSSNPRLPNSCRSPSLVDCENGASSTILY